MIFSFFCQPKKIRIIYWLLFINTSQWLYFTSFPKCLLSRYLVFWIITEQFKVSRHLIFVISCFSKNWLKTTKNHNQKGKLFNILFSPYCIYIKFWWCFTDKKSHNSVLQFFHLLLEWPAVLVYAVCNHSTVHVDSSHSGLWKKSLW